jgi:hypothetical protein
MHAHFFFFFKFQERCTKSEARRYSGKKERLHLSSLPCTSWAAFVLFSLPSFLEYLQADIKYMGKFFVIRQQKGEGEKKREGKGYRKIIPATTITKKNSRKKKRRSLYYITKHSVVTFSVHLASFIDACFFFFFFFARPVSYIRHGSEQPYKHKKQQQKKASSNKPTTHENERRGSGPFAITSFLLFVAWSPKTGQ